MASMMRESSPPETMRASGRRSSPGFGETKNSARRCRCAVQAASGSGARRTGPRSACCSIASSREQPPRAPCEAPRRPRGARSRQRLGGRQVARRAPPRARARARRCARRPARSSSQLAPQRVAPRDDVGQRRPVLPLQPLEQRQPILDLLQPRRRRLDAVGVAAQEDREILELRLDAVARVQVRLELRIERRQLADAAPDAAERREHRVVALVQRRVALGAQPLDALGVRQHLPRARASSSSSPGRLERRPIELGELERRPDPGARRGRDRGAASARELVPMRAQRVEGRGDRREQARRAPPKASSTPRCVDGSSSVWCSCWPCSSMSRDDRSFSAPAVASAPLMNARLRPCAVISRRTSSSSPPLSKIASIARGVLAGADEVARRAAAEQQADRLDEDRLAGPGLAGQDVEAGLELDLDRVDDREMLDAEEAEHAEKRENSNRNIGLTAVSRHDTVLHILVRGSAPARCPSGAQLCRGGPFAHAWKPAARPAAAGAGLVLRPTGSSTGILGLHRQLEPRFASRSR